MASGERTAAVLQALNSPGDNASLQLPFGLGGFTIPAGAIGVALAGGTEPVGSSETLPSGVTTGYGTSGSSTQNPVIAEQLAAATNSSALSNSDWIFIILGVAGLLLTIYYGERQ